VALALLTALKVHIDLLQQILVLAAQVIAGDVIQMVNASIVEIASISTMSSLLVLLALPFLIVLTVSQEQVNALLALQDMAWKTMHVFLKLLAQYQTALFVLPVTPPNAKPAKADIPTPTQVFVLESDARAHNF